MKPKNLQATIGNLLDLSYRHLSTMRSFELLRHRAMLIGGYQIPGNMRASADPADKKPEPGDDKAKSKEDQGSGTKAEKKEGSSAQETDLNADVDNHVETENADEKKDEASEVAKLEDQDLEGLEVLKTVRRLDMTEKDATRGRKEVMSVDVRREDGLQLFRMEAVMKWSGTRCHLLNLDNNNILQISTKNVHIGCYRSQTLTVIHVESNIKLGSISFGKEEAVVYDAWGNKVLRILKRESESKKVEHIIVETDNTRVGSITGTAVKYSKYIDVYQRAVLLGGWIPTGVEAHKGM